MLLSFLYIFLSLVLLYFGADWLVKGSSLFAFRKGISPLIIGLTIVAFGTSSPELLVSIMATIDHQGGIAIGNVIGSNIFNICVILGIAALISPLKIKLQILKIDIPVVIGSTLIFMLMFRDRSLDRYEGMILLAFLIIYTIVNIHLARKEKNKEVLEEYSDEIPVKLKSRWMEYALMLGGLVLLLAGSKLLVFGAVDVARALGVGETIIGLTIIAAGTSMPELATSAFAAYRKEYDIAIGNVIGSCTFNLLGILGVASVVNPISAMAISNIDLYILLGTSLILLPFFRTKFTLKKDEAFILLFLYGIYLYYLWPK
ncbi:MAG: calcium/sodium antiporter [Bacteroidales bacterium]|nr:calcium/sodium antiporter [Bacteroidales bacterium]